MYLDFLDIDGEYKLQLDPYRHKVFDSGYQCLANPDNSYNLTHTAYQTLLTKQDK